MASATSNRARLCSLLLLLACAANIIEAARYADMFVSGSNSQMAIENNTFIGASLYSTFANLTGVVVSCVKRS